MVDKEKPAWDTSDTYKIKELPYNILILKSYICFCFKFTL